MNKDFEVIVEPEGIRGFFSEGMTLYKALYTLGIPINASCGGFGKCGRCFIKIIGDAPPRGESDRLYISEPMLEEGFRLACQTRIKGDMKIFVPPETRRMVSQTIYEKSRKITIHPFVKKIYAKLPAIDIKKKHSYFDIVKNILGDEFYPSFDFLKGCLPLPEEGTFVAYSNEVIVFEENDTTDKSYGIAVDIGTTTITALLVNLTDGSTLSRKFTVNPQAAFGEDVISRIANALNEYGLHDLQTSVRGVVDLLINELVKNTGIEKKHIYEITFVGNTAMHHLFLGIPSNSLAVSPYIPLFRDSVLLKVKEFPLVLPSYTRCYFFPNIAGFVGGDTVGTILSSGILHKRKVTLLIDIGTNGEVVLGSKDRACALSCAAGPAFEGISLSCGMPASEGAIEGVDIEDGNIKLRVIGGGKPKGICGSGVTDLLAYLVKEGIIDEGGVFKKDERIISTGHGETFSLTEDVYISQRDVRQLQLAKAAIRAGIEMLKKHMGIKNEDIDDVLIAGAFGNFLRSESLTEVGIIPKELLGKIRFIGNAALEGARLALLSQKLRKEVETIPERVEYLELMGRKDFQEEFLNAMIF